MGSLKNRDWLLKVIFKFGDTIKAFEEIAAEENDEHLKGVAKDLRKDEEYLTRHTFRNYR